ncbi:RNA polymerase sigma factor [Streptomyces sp. NPDC087300]|uniref:RNA polymerase sigma factor n=1 Tax=Streptomyces sp. NPDC087300 TaxID=3365780 RepID=UPI00380E7F15
MNDHNTSEGREPPRTVPASDSPSVQHRHLRAKADEEFAAFYRETIHKLTGFLMQHGAPLPLAADIAQDTMIKAYQRWGGIHQPKAWVHAVASRALVRAAADVRERPLEQPEPTSLLPAPDAFAQWELRHDTLQLLKKLPYRQRQIMAWTLSGYAPSEIAVQLQLTPEAVRASLKKARRALAQHAPNGRRNA